MGGVRFIFDVRKSRNAGVMRAVWNGVQIWARVEIARRENDTGWLKLLFSQGGGAGGLFGNRRSWPGCGWFGRAAAVRSGYFAPRRIVGTQKATFRRGCVARRAAI